ncbi:hypothetical protein [Haliscomenobacter sp.]|uniref:beta strand repeat-containing protein n=1 Tax=Haliscomenobacter sp. TaxID=2717303 RepID=UPI0033650E08
MAFPSTPTNGQIAVVGGIAYQYATTPNSWSRILSSANIITANAISVNTLTANTLNVNNNLYNIAGNISATGNVTGNYILGNGSLLTGIAGGGGTSIANGTSNITITSSGGNATVNIGGTANVAVFATTGEYVTGVVSASGNVTGGNLLTGGLISATGALTVTGSTFLANVSAGNIDAGTVYSGGNITTNGQISATGNIITNGQISVVGNVTAASGLFTNIVNVASFTGAVVSVSGNITGGNVVTGGLISATGNVSSGASINTVNLSVSGNVLGNLLPSADITYNLGSPTQRWNTLYLAGNTIELGTQSISATATGVSLGTGDLIGGNVTTTGLISATGNITGGNIRTGGLISATGNVIANNGMFTTIVNVASHTGAVVSVSGNVTSGNVNADGLVSATGNVTANNGMFTTIVNTASHTGGLVSVTGNITANNGMFTTIVNTASHTGAVVSVSGNVTGNYFVGNGSLLTGISGGGGGGANIANGTSNITIASSGGNATVNIGGTANVAVFATTGEFVTGVISATGNITGGNVNTGGLISATGNVTGGNISTAGNLTFSSTAQRILGDFGNATIASRPMFQSSTANSNTILIVIPSGTGNLSSFSALNNSNTTNTSTIQIIAAAADSRLQAGQIGTGSYLPLTFYTGGSERARIDTNGNVGIGNTAPTTNLAVAGTAYVSGNITGGNVSGTLLTGTLATAAQANITSVGTLGALAVSGNVTGGNLTTAGIITVNSSAAVTAIVNGAGNAVGNIGSSGIYFNRLFAQATTALYADLAEVYKSDAEYPPGTVLVFGGDQEVTVSNSSHDARIAGVVSTNPAHVMNSGLVSEFTVEVGLIGRVPCQVIGPVAVGDRVVSSSRAGVAERLDMQHYQPGVIIGKAVESYNGTGVGTIEVVVGRL